VTGVAGFFYIIPKSDIKGLMWICMAAEAVFKREVGLILMAVGAFGDQRAFRGSGRMFSGVTLETVNFGFMLGPGFINLYYNGNVAFFTIGFFEFGIESGISVLDVSPQSGKDKTKQCRRSQQK
jgi:hypothetical protein